MAEQTKSATDERKQLDRITRRCREVVHNLCAGSSSDERRRTVRVMFRALAVLLADTRMPAERHCYRDIVTAADAVRSAAVGGGTELADAFDQSCTKVARATGIDLLDPNPYPADPTVFSGVARALLSPEEASLHRIFFETMPLHWIGCLYESLLDYLGARTESTKTKYTVTRKRRGIYFTPRPLVEYVVRTVLNLLSVDLLSPTGVNIKVLDPAMGCGAFLVHLTELLGQSSNNEHLKAHTARDCVYGVDIDPDAVDISRFAVWAAAGFADGIADSLKRHLICGDALSGEIPTAEPEADSRSERSSFDAVVGNPPYVSSKNGIDFRAKLIGQQGQVDTYLLFLSMVLDRELVRHGGVLSMVLPDPVLIRANAEKLRRTLAREWNIESILHILGAFQGAGVANAVVTARNEPPKEQYFTVSRIEKISQTQAFSSEPITTAGSLAKMVSRSVVLAQPRCEFLYLLEEDPFVETIRRIHGPSLALDHYQTPFVPLHKLNVRAIYRGEEIGKSAIVSRVGDMPILKGGQSIRPYEIVWEGFWIANDQIRKPLARYRRTKILMQKSAGKIIAALDEVHGNHQGYVFPQSVYAIELDSTGMGHLYLLCLLNSQVMSEYIKRTATGYKLVQPQIEIEDLRALPIRRIAFTTPQRKRRDEVSRAISIFETECLRADEKAHFPELRDFARSCLVSNPEMSDVVHDILAYLGRLAVDLSQKNRRSPSPNGTKQLECVRAAIDSVVEELYGCEPAQFSFHV
ncbi:MAG: N-6 DNA methylase [Armatimonadota bacterium]|nr:N-6 DNA methylase [Armatimonadota bacterium]